MRKLPPGILVATGYAQSATASATYTINPPAAKPTFSQPSLANFTTKSVAMIDSTSGATIHYTTDGSTPTIASTKYAGPIIVTRTETISAIAVGPGYSPSPVATLTVKIAAPIKVNESF